MFKKALPVVAVLTLSLSSTALTPPPTLGGYSPEAHLAPTTNQQWWPKQLNLQPLRDNSAASNPFGADFNYSEEFQKIDLVELKSEIEALMTTSQAWWPADYGHYGPFFIRMAWHSAGTYRTFDGRGGAGGGQQRFEPLNSWPDNGNLDKARRLLWPIKQKYGTSISWADLMVLAGNVAMESMGFKTFGFAGGRADDWEAELVYWGPEAEFLGSKRHTGERKLEKPLAASRMGLIYVNPEGPNGNGDPISAAHDIRDTFGRMAMNDEETVALIAGGHTFGKAHGAHKPEECVGVEPAAAGVEAQGLGWKNKCGTGKGVDATTSGLEGAWTFNPTEWTHQFFNNLFAFEWVQTKSPAGATQWIPKDENTHDLVLDAHDPDRRHAPIMLTTDLSLKADPEYRKISQRFLDNPEEFEDAFARAWFKLTHRDMGPAARYLGDMAPAEQLAWQDPVPTVDHKLVGDRDVKKIKRAILDSGLTVPELVRTAWASAASYRGTDMRGGSNGGRLRLAPQKDWAVNNPAELDRVLNVLEGVQSDFNGSASRGKRVSMADVIVLAGAAAIEKAAKDGGFDVDVPFKAGRGDATQAQTDVNSFGVLEPTADGFRNYVSANHQAAPSKLLVERADLLGLTVPEMTVLVGGMRALNANIGGASHGVLTNTPGVLTNDFFVNLLDMITRWEPSKTEDGVYEGRNRVNGELTWTATEVDLVFGSNAELRAVAEAYAFNGSKEKFVQDFVNAWTKVMNLGRF